MCGIVGLITKSKHSGFTFNQQKMFDQLLYVDVLRGEDATGVIGVMKDGDFTIMKEASDSSVFAYTYNGSQLHTDLYQKGVAAIGHNRAKTIGANSDENAHPFVEGDTFAMVHNGTLRGHRHLADTDVDSHALTITFKTAMEQEDWKDAMEKALGKVNGAFACVWYDQKKHQVCMIRNTERPLDLCITDSCMLFGSESMALTWIAVRNQAKIEKVMTLVPHTLYQFDLSKQGGDYSETFLSPQRPITESSHSPNNNGAESAGDTLSKNQSKVLTKRLMNQRIWFWVDDFVEQVIGQPGPAEQVIMMGSVVSSEDTHNLQAYPHTIRAAVNLPSLGLEESDLFGAIKFSGTVLYTIYEKDTKSLTIWLSDIQLEEKSRQHETVH